MEYKIIGYKENTKNPNYPFLQLQISEREIEFFMTIPISLLRELITEKNIGKFSHLVGYTIRIEIE